MIGLSGLIMLTFGLDSTYKLYCFSLFWLIYNSFTGSNQGKSSDLVKRPLHEADTEISVMACFGLYGVHALHIGA